MSRSLAKRKKKKELHGAYLIFVFKKSEQLQRYKTLTAFRSLRTLGKDHYNPV